MSIASMAFIASALVWRIGVPSGKNRFTVKALCRSLGKNDVPIVACTTSIPAIRIAVSIVDNSLFQARRPVCISRKW